MCVCNMPVSDILAQIKANSDKLAGEIAHYSSLINSLVEGCAIPMTDKPDDDRTVIVQIRFYSSNFGRKLCFGRNEFTQKHEPRYANLNYEPLSPNSGIVQDLILSGNIERFMNFLTTVILPLHMKGEVSFPEFRF